MDPHTVKYCNKPQNYNETLDDIVTEDSIEMSHNVMKILITSMHLVGIEAYHNV